jgi:TatD DNase family protein
MHPIIDTHAHLCDPVFDEDRGNILKDAKKKGISTVITVSENLKDARTNIKLAQTHPGLRPAAGLYPTYLNRSDALAVQSFIRKEQHRLIAIGEVGLDYWAVKAEADRETQRDIFQCFIDLSMELNLPLNVHSRSAGRPAIGLLLSRGATRVHLHAFDGKAASALPAVEAGYFFSIPPSIVRSPQKQKLVKRLPLSSLLIETDSPVLGPSPTGRNEPANAWVAVRMIATLKDIHEEEVLESTYHNTQTLYGDLHAGTGNE